MTVGNEYRFPVRRAYLVDFVATDAVAALNAVRWLANPGPRRPLHVTLRGPYPLDEDPTTAEVLTAVNAELTGREITLAGVDEFRNRGRRIVFLSVPDRLIDSLGDARGESYVAHATIYDGKDHAVAKALLGRLARLPKLVVRVAAVNPATIGTADNPLDAAVLQTAIAQRALGAAGLNAGEMSDSIPPIRLRVIEALVAQLRAGAVQP